MKWKIFPSSALKSGLCKDLNGNDLTRSAEKIIEGYDEERPKIPYVKCYTVEQEIFTAENILWCILAMY